MTSIKGLDCISDQIRNARTRECVDAVLGVLPKGLKGAEARSLLGLIHEARGRIGILDEELSPSRRLEKVIQGDKGGLLSVVLDFNHNGTPMLTILQARGADFFGIRKGSVALTTLPRPLEPILAILIRDKATWPFLDRLV